MNELGNINHPIKRKKATCYRCHKRGRKRNSKLCQSCHKEKKHGTVVECLTCHGMHFSTNTKLVNKTNKKTCLSCHQDRDFNHSNTTKVLYGAINVKNVILDDGVITCMTCHGGHKKYISWKTVQKYCNNCHGTDKKKIHKKFHKLLKVP